MDTKHNLLKINAIIISEKNYNDYDKLLTLLTDKLGRISVYAFGVRRQKSKNIGKTRIYTSGQFEIRKIGDRYQLSDVTKCKIFNNLIVDYDKMCYASYFSKLIEYFSVENDDMTNILFLFHYTLKTLNENIVDNKLVRCIFELKMLKYAGIYMEANDIIFDSKCSDNTIKTIKYVWNFILNTDVSEVFSFKVSNDILATLTEILRNEVNTKVNKRFKDLENIE